MKLKSLLFGLTAAALTGASAHAATTLYITGSTAYRAPAIAAILSYLNNHTVNNVVNGAIVNTTDTTATAGDLFGASQGTYENSDASIIIETNFTGSAAGLVDLVTAHAQTTFVAPSAPMSAIVIPGLVGPSGATASTYGTIVTSGSDSEIPNVTFSDTFKATVASVVTDATISPSITDANDVNGVAISKGSQLAAQINNSNVGNLGTSGNAGSQDAVGIVPFAWYTGNSSSSTQSGITNVGQNTAAQLITGPTPVQLFTGVASPAGNVFLVGRNEDSGTRVEAFAEAQKGYNATPDQFELTFSSGGTNNTGKITFSTASGNTSSEDSDYPAGTVKLPVGGLSGSSLAVVSSANDFEDDAALYTQASIAWGASGHSGYAAGGDVSNCLLSDNANPATTAANIDGGGAFTGNAFFMGYLGWADGYGLLHPKSGTSTAYMCYYNGVQPTVANVQNGIYTFWGFEHMYYMSGGNTSNVLTSGGAAVTAANSIADSVFNTYAATNSAGATDATMAETPTVAGILYKTVTVKRSQEGKPVTTK